MSYCSNCGARVGDSAIFCPNCGASTSRGGSSDARYTGGYFHTAPTLDYTESVALAILSFIFPVVGIILWLACRSGSPGKATSALKGLWAYLCSYIPLVGFIMYFVWKRKRPDFAKIGLVVALIYFGVACFFGIIWGGSAIPDFFEGLADSLSAFVPTVLC